eukprot:Skav208586  [mRNA]  locus=scaffold3152:68059:72795:+ [translate_table: standard]
MDHVASSESQSWGYVQADEAINLCPTVIFQTPVESVWWMAHVTRFASQLILMSPPCPPWSAADQSPGLNRGDGMCIIVVIIILGYLRPRVWGLENVSTLKSHRHWDIVIAVIKWTNFQVQWSRCLDLEDQTPQHRERLLLFATNRLDEDLSSHKPVAWPMKQKNTLRSCHVICSLDDFFKDMATLKPHELSMYLDTKLLPKDVTKPHRKRTARDLVQYRLRSLDDGFACVMTTYGRPDSVHEDLLARGGLYGALYHDGNEVRKLTPPEICILFGLTSDIWLPREEYISVSLLGNSIAVPHALILILNMAACVRPFWFLRGIDSTFAQCMADPINATNMLIEHTDDGFWIRKRDGQLGIPPTIPIHDFALVSTASPLQTVRLYVEVGMNVSMVLQHVLGNSLPAKLDILVKGAGSLRVQMHAEMSMPTGRLKLSSTVPCCFLPSDDAMKSTTWPFVAVMCIEDIVVMKRERHMKCDDIRQCLACNVHHEHADGTCFDVYGIPICEDDEVPNVILYHRAIDVESMVAVMPDGCSWQSKPQSFCMQLEAGYIPPVEHCLRNTGIFDFLLCLGWEVHTVWIHKFVEEDAKLVIMPTDGRLNVQREAVANLMLIRWMQGELAQWQTQADFHVEVRVHLWGAWIWDGKCQTTMIGRDVITCWENAAAAMGSKSKMKITMDQHDFDMDVPLSDYIASASQYIKLHLVPIKHEHKHDDDEQHNKQCRNTKDDMATPHAAFEEHAVSKMVGGMIEDFRNTLGDQRMPDDLFLPMMIFKDVNFMCVTNAMGYIIRLMKFFRDMGIERELNKAGWQIVVQLLDYVDEMDSQAQMKITPIHGKKRLSMEVIHSFIFAALFCARLPVPQRACDCEKRWIKVQTKYLDQWVLQGKFAATEKCGIFNQPWHDVSVRMENDSHLRMICRGRMLIDERILGDVIDEDKHPEDSLKVHFVLQLKGGGVKPQKPGAVTATKNDLARLFLQIGCELHQTTKTVDKLMQLNGIAAIKHALRQKDAASRLSQLERLARINDIELPPHNVAELKRNHANQARQHKQALRSQEFSVSDYSLCGGVFKNQDGTDSPLIDSIKHGAHGVMLSCSQSAEPWLQHTARISQDELGLLIMGCCDDPQKHGCTRHSIPATTCEGSPVVIDACLHQLGHKEVVVTTPKGAKVDLHDSTVVAVTMYRDEMEQTAWRDVLKVPVKVAMEGFRKAHVTFSMISAPWGRTWANEHGKCTPDNAKSFQFHMRVLSSDLEPILRASGMHGLCCVPKTESREINQDYAIIWMDGDLQTLQVKAAACQFGMGLVRATKGVTEKTSRGIRVKQSSFEEAHKALKPGVEVPQQVIVHHVAKFAPLPNGATQDSIRAWLDKLGIVAKPMKPMGPKAWMIGCTKKFDEQFLTWNDSVFLVTWLQDKNQPRPTPVLAGKRPKNDKSSSTASEDTLMSDDPWMPFFQKKGIQPNAMKPVSQAAPPVAAARVVEGPIEERFKGQDAKMEQLQMTVEAMNKRLDQQDAHNKTFESNVQTHMTQIQEGVNKQIASLTTAFEDSVTRAIRKQDKQLSDSMAEIKQLLKDQGTPRKTRKTDQDNGQVD